MTPGARSFSLRCPEGKAATSGARSFSLRYYFPIYFLHSPSVPASIVTPVSSLRYERRTRRPETGTAL